MGHALHWLKIVVGTYTSQWTTHHIKPCIILTTSHLCAITTQPDIFRFGAVFTARVAKRAKVMFSQAFVCPTRRGGGGEVGNIIGQPPPSGPVHNTSLPPYPPGTRSQQLPPSLSQDQVTTPPSPQDQVTTPPSLPPGTSSQHLLPSPPDQVTTPPSPLGPGHNTSPPPPGPGHNTSLPPGPGHNTSLPPGPGDNTFLPPPLGPGHNTYLPPSPGTRSQHLPPPRTRSQHLPPPPPPPPLGPVHNTSTPRDQVTTPPSPWDQVTTPPPPPRTRSQNLPPPGPGHNTSLPHPRDYAQAGGTHPTGMHSCFVFFKLAESHVDAQTPVRCLVLSEKSWIRTVTVL